MDTFQFKQIANVLQLLPTKAINYFSFTIFEKQQSIITYCNNQEWLNYCKNHYDEDIYFSVQKYILSSRLNVINWELLNLDQQTKEYIQKRNDIAGIKASISLLYQKNIRLIAVTFGTKQDSGYLINFFNYKIDYVSLIMRNLIEQRM